MLLSTTTTFSFSYQILDMTDKRDATMAELPWPTLNRIGSTSRPMGSSDSDMIDDIGHETFAPLAPTIPPAAAPAPSSNLVSHRLPFSTITTKITPTMDHGHRVLHHVGNYPH